MMFCNNSDLLFLIPAAGFGRRVGSPESKEMQFRSETKRHIDFALELAREKNCASHVISRIEKKSLNDYLTARSKDQAISVQLIEPTRDWPETLLMSHSYWREWNLVFLPDMDFSPLRTLDFMVNEMKQASLDPDKSSQILVAEHEVGDPHKWGFLTAIDESADVIQIGEKPKTALTNRAWGLYAFRKDHGRRILEAQLNSTLSGEWQSVSGRIKSFKLDSFRDLTRG